MRRKHRAIPVLASVLLALTSTACVGGATNAQRQGLMQIGDTRAAVLPPLGLLWSRVKAPLFSGAPENVGPRKGEATVNQIAIPPLPVPGMATGIPLVSWGDASRASAAQDGNIETVSHMDFELTTLLLFYRRFKVIAYGE